MHQCDVCNQSKDTPDLLSTDVVTEQHHTKSIHICSTCIVYVCDDIKMGEWFPLKSTDEMVRLPDRFYMRL